MNEAGVDVEQVVPNRARETDAVPPTGGIHDGALDQARSEARQERRP